MLPSGSDSDRLGDLGGMWRLSTASYVTDLKHTPTKHPLFVFPSFCAHIQASDTKRPSHTHFFFFQIYTYKSLLGAFKLFF